METVPLPSFGVEFTLDCSVPDSYGGYPQFVVSRHYKLKAFDLVDVWPSVMVRNFGSPNYYQSLSLIPEDNTTWKLTEVKSQYLDWINLEDFQTLNDMIEHLTYNPTPFPLPLLDHILEESDRLPKEFITAISKFAKLIQSYPYIHRHF